MCEQELQPTKRGQSVRSHLVSMVHRIMGSIFCVHLISPVMDSTQQLILATHTTTIWQLLDLAAEISCNKLFVMKWQDFTKTNQLVFITKETLQKQIWYIKVLHFSLFPVYNI